MKRKPKKRSASELDSISLRTILDSMVEAVLVVDDETRLRRFLRTGFELEGFTVQEASGGEEAIKAAALKPFDLIVLDLGLPDMDGQKVAERIRTWSQVPIFVLSVRKSEDEKVRLFDLGVDDYVVKPFAMGEFLARARAAVRRHSRTVQGDPLVVSGPLSFDLAARNRDVQRQPHPAFAQGIPCCCRCGAASRHRRHASTLAQRGMGCKPRQRLALPENLHPEIAPEDRAGSGQAAHPADRLGVGYRLAQSADRSAAL